MGGVFCESPGLTQKNTRNATWKSTWMVPSSEMMRFRPSAMTPPRACGETDARARCHLCWAQKQTQTVSSLADDPATIRPSNRSLPGGKEKHTPGQLLGPGLMLLHWLLALRLSFCSDGKGGGKHISGRRLQNPEPDPVHFRRELEAPVGRPPPRSHPTRREEGRIKTTQ